MNKPVAVLCAAVLAAAVGCGDKPSEATPVTVPPPQKPPRGKLTLGSPGGKAKADPAAGPAAKP